MGLLWVLFGVLWFSLLRMLLFYRGFLGFDVVLGFC